MEVCSFLTEYLESLLSLTTSFNFGHFRLVLKLVLNLGGRNPKKSETLVCRHAPINHQAEWQLTCNESELRFSLCTQ